MVKNVRWLYNKLGTVDISATGSNTISGGISAVQNNIDGKANASHTHGVGDLPVSNSSVNSTSYVPSSAVVYSLKSTIGDLGSEIVDLEDNVLNPNKQYESKNLGSLSSISDVDTFLSRFNHDNLYNDGETRLALGNYITINTGGVTNGLKWEIAGFDLEHNQTAADGTVYDNGYGICLIPVEGTYNVNWTHRQDYLGYKGSYIHSTVVSNICTDITNIFGSHIVNRNVLLSNSVSTSSPYYSNGYTWTMAKGTLMSVGQLTGSFTRHSTKYDDGEANYKLPLFDYENYYTGRNFWTRGLTGTSRDGSYYIWTVTGDEFYEFGIQRIYYDETCITRPMIYIR